VFNRVRTARVSVLARLAHSKPPSSESYSFSTPDVDDGKVS
jgi:hypothetical protein